jgi:hypothetical protein
MPEVKIVRQREIDTFDEWKDQPCKCIHCGRTLKNIYAKNSHLSHCKARQLQRFFKVGKYLFTVRSNPLKRKMLVINEEIQETHDAKIIVGLLKGFMKYGLISTFTATELSGSPTMLEYPDGVVKFPELKRRLNPDDMLSFKTAVENVKSQNLNTAVEQTINKPVEGKNS